MPVTDPDWHSMECGLCPEVWWIPYGSHPYGIIVLDRSYAHWREHVKRGEDPRVPNLRKEPS